MKKALWILFVLVLLVTLAAAAQAAVLQQDENGEYYVNFPASGGAKYIYIPEGITTFKVYDDGGKDGNHSYHADGQIYLYPPSGYSFIVSGTLTVPNEGFLCLNLYYDDVFMIKSSGDGQPVSTCRYYIDEKERFVMWLKSYNQFSDTDCEDTFAGLDLTVTLYELNELNVSHEIRIAPSDGGLVTSDYSTAQK